jgi:TPP-dependent 2-oxoacid decarboxylase
MSSPFTIGAYLLSRLKELGVQHIFGVPGDFNLAFIDAIEQAQDMKWIGTCNELNAAYAADGYARLAGVGAFLTTMGVGELSAINGLAGSYAERVPVVQITGVASLKTIAAGALVHHTLGDGNFTHFSTMVKEVTIAQTTPTSENARAEIDRVLRACWYQKRPVQINLPTDVYTAATEPPTGLLLTHDEESNPTMLEDFLAQALPRIAGAQHAAILADCEVARYHLVEPLYSLVQTTGFPFALLSASKGMLDETHAQFLGIYQGAVGDPAIKERIEEADCLLCIGTRLTDMATGFSHRLNPHNTIEIHPEYARIEDTIFQGLAMQDVLQHLVQRLPQRKLAQINLPIRTEKDLTRQEPWEPQSATPLTQPRLWQAIGNILREDDVLLVEQGTSFYSALTVPLPTRTAFITQPLWASIGYTLPALLGTMHAAPERRQLLVIGDGSLQMTVQELSTILQQELHPVIMVINNEGYTVERVVHRPEQHYHDIQRWQYHQLPALFSTSHNFISSQVSNEEELAHALLNAGQHPEVLHFIEVKVPRDDVPENLRMLCETLARRNNLANKAHLEPDAPSLLAQSHD